MVKSEIIRKTEHPTAADTLNALRASNNLNALAARGESPLMREVFGKPKPEPVQLKK